jgi:hypothetical protein
MLDEVFRIAERANLSVNRRDDSCVDPSSDGVADLNGPNVLAFYASVNVVGATASPANKVASNLILTVPRLRFHPVEVIVDSCDLVRGFSDCLSSCLTGFKGCIHGSIPVTIL